MSDTPPPVPATEVEAVAMGWTVDRHTYPWVAYLGPRFTPTRLVEIATPGVPR